MSSQAEETEQQDPEKLFTAIDIKHPKLSRITDRFGHTFYFGNVGNYWYPAFPIGPDLDYWTHLQNIRNMEIRQDDVIIFSYPKTGCHWTQEIVNMLMKKSSQFTSHKGDLDCFLDFIPMSHIDKRPSPRLLVTHIPFRFIPKQLFEKKVKVIFLERNPKDVIVSYYNHHHAHVPPLGYPGTFEQFFHVMFEVGYVYGDLFEYLMNWQKGLEDHPEIDYFVSVFEDMKLDPVKGVKALNKYLETGCSDQLCEEIAVACTFKSMKVFKDADSPMEVNALFKNNIPAFYRKGDVGDWKNWFTVAMNEEFDEMYKKRMADYKFTYKYTI